MPVFAGLTPNNGFEKEQDGGCPNLMIISLKSVEISRQDSVTPVLFLTALESCCHKRACVLGLLM